MPFSLFYDKKFKNNLNENHVHAILFLLPINDFAKTVLTNYNLHVKLYFVASNDLDKQLILIPQ